MTRLRTHSNPWWRTLVLIICAAFIGMTLPFSSAFAQDNGAAADGGASGVFSQDVDLTQLGTLAVHYEGRIKSLDSFASQMMQLVTGPREVNGQTPTYTYLDMMFRPQAYDNVPFVFVKKKPVRADIAAAVQADPQAVSIQNLDAVLYHFTETGLMPPSFLQLRTVQDLLRRLNGDLIKSAKFVQAIQTAMNVAQPDTLKAILRCVPPGEQDFANTQWLSFEEVMMGGDPRLASMTSEQIEAVNMQYLELRDGWVMRDAARVETAAMQLTTLLAEIGGEFYPDTKRLELESMYFRMKNFVWIWIFYALALVPLLLATVFRWKGARTLAMGMFIATFLLHTFAIGLRWYVAQRWPNSNMFEAVTTAAWFGGCGAIVLEVWARKTPMRNLFALGSAVSSMVALMCAHFMPLELNANISNMMPVLHDVWLYIHTNVIIFSYCLIFMAAVSGILYLGRRAIMMFTGTSGTSEFARVGGAASLIMTSPDGNSYLSREKTTFGQVLDGTTMVLMELSFILLWAGIVMGAIWADHSWGRPWGWDPKEVFALNTFIIFAILIHVRLKVKDKGLWTAILAVIGAIVMLFNWIFINFFIVGLHSYA